MTNEDRRTDRKDAVMGWTISIVLHALLLLGFTFVKFEPVVTPAGFVEVEFGPIAEGRPVAKAEVKTEPVPEEMDDNEDQPEPDAEVPEKVEEGKIVDLPEEVEETQPEEVIQTPETDVIGQEETQVEDQGEEEVIREQSTVKPGADPEGEGGAETGDTGTGLDEFKTAPYSLEGIDRKPMRAPTPDYTDQVNRVIVFRITVDPSGRITKMIPMRRGSAALEKAVREALTKWRFNPLAANVPQESQEGTISFNFRRQ